MLKKAPMPVPRKIIGMASDRNCKSSKIFNQTSDKKLIRAPTNNEVDEIKEGNMNLSSREDPDLNLSTLICSVERDIELLEQLEMNSGAHRGSLPLPVTAQLLALPGYRPRGSNSNSENGSGQIRAIGNPDRRSSIETAKYTNPGYDALLCTRLYQDVPSTPPPLPRKSRGHRRTNSDSTMNRSKQRHSLEENPSTPASPSEALIASKLSNHLLQQPQPIFCPFCLGHFYEPLELQDHLLQSHSEELTKLKKDKNTHFKRETCPCCEAEFLKSGLGPHHLVQHHPQYVCNLMFGKPPASPAPNSAAPHFLPATPPPERHAFCLLCGQRFLKKHIKLLALHLQQQHPKKFSQVMDTYFVKEMKLEEKQNYGAFDLKRAPSPLHYYESIDTPRITNKDSKEIGLPKKSLEYEKFKVKERNNNKVQSVNKRLKIDSDSIQQTPQRSRNSKSFRRPIPLHPSGLETYHGLPQPEPPAGPITGMGSESYLAEDDSISIAKEKEIYSHYTYNSDKALFRCNLCGDRFADNSNLLLHLKTNHMAVSRALKAQFSCAKCPAKFFKNAFLLKHSLTHSID